MHQICGRQSLLCKCFVENSTLACWCWHAQQVNKFRFWFLTDQKSKEVIILWILTMSSNIEVEVDEVPSSLATIGGPSRRTSDLWNQANSCQRISKAYPESGWILRYEDFKSTLVSLFWLLFFLVVHKAFWLNWTVSLSRTYWLLKTMRTLITLLWVLCSGQADQVSCFLP